MKKSKRKKYLYRYNCYEQNATWLKIKGPNRVEYTDDEIELAVKAGDSEYQFEDDLYRLKSVSHYNGFKTIASAKREYIRSAKETIKNYKEVIKMMEGKK